MEHSLKPPRLALVLALAVAALALAVGGCGDDDGAPGGGDGGADAATDAPPQADAARDAAPLPDAMAPPNSAALSFDGVDDRVVVAPSASLAGLAGLTFEAWIRPAALDRRQLIAGNPSQGGGWQYALAIRADNALELTVSGASTCVAFGAATVLEVGTWTHVAGTWSPPPATLKLFVNGAQVTQGTCTTTFGTEVSGLAIGATSTGDEPFAGLIDELRLWNIERTGPDIQAARSRTLVGDEHGLVGYWRFDEGSGDLASDATLDNNHGRLGAAAGADAADPTWTTDLPF